MKFSILIFGVLLANLVSAQVNLYGQCGGIGYFGDKTCIAGTICTKLNDWFYQCLLDTSNNVGLVNLYGQCGGLGYSGPNKCVSVAVCIYLNPWYSQCQLMPSSLASIRTTLRTTATTTTFKPITIPTIKTTLRTIYTTTATTSTLKTITSSITNPTTTFKTEYQYFTAKNGHLFDANGIDFLIRGINSAHLWYDNYNRNYAYKSLTSINNANANLVRIVWGMNPDGGLSTSNLEDIIKRIIELKMIPMIELHDATGSRDVSQLLECAYWFKNNIDLFNRYKKYILINIANEWSPWGTSLEYWRDSYKLAISIIRSSGWAGALVIDASAYAQNPDGPIKYGNELVQGDPYKNLIFSIHMYAEWKIRNGNYKIVDKLTELKNQNLTILIGEFASTHPEGCSWVNIDVYEILRQSKSKNIGYIGWSWHGNGKGDCNYDLKPLNIVEGDASIESTWTSNNYTNWGNILINSPNYGIKDTSFRASYFW